MAINKNFVVKNGLEVNTNLILADATRNNVGIGSTIPTTKLDVRGGIAATDIYAVGLVTFTNELNVGTGGTVLTVLGIGSIGIGTINPAFLLDIRSTVSTGRTAFYVQGDARITGDLVVEDDLVFNEFTALNANITGVATIATLGVTGITTTRNLTVTGISTFVGLATFNSGLLVVSGITTLGVTTATNLTSQQLNVSGITTLGVTTATNLTSQQLNVSGISTFNNTLNVVPTSTGVAGLFSGTTSGDMVRITQLGSGVALRIEDEANPDATPFVVKADGFVGIGTINPTVNLQLSPTGSISNVGTGITLVGTVGSALTVAQFIHYNSNASYLRIKATRNTAGSDWQSASTKLVNVTDTTEQGYIEYNPDGSTNGIAFGRATTEWARFLSGGNLGIGTTSPTSKLHVVGDVLVSGTSTLGTLRVSSGIVTAASGIVTYYGDGSKLTGVAASTGGTIGIQSGGVTVGTGITTINFVGTGLTASQSSNTSNVYLPDPGVSLGLAIALGG